MLLKKNLPNLNGAFKLFASTQMTKDWLAYSDSLIDYGGVAKGEVGAKLKAAYYRRAKRGSRI